jgi:phosphate transport system permease protein
MPLSWDFLVSEPLKSGRAGGIGSILFSNVLILLVCMLVSMPISLGAAIYLSEFSPKQNYFGRIVRLSLDVLSATPSIVFGLFGNVLFCRVMGLGFSIASGGLTLACMVLPLMIRSAEQGLRMVSQDFRLGAAALGFSAKSTIFSILIPCAAPSLIAGFIVSLGRALAETAALIFTSGYVDRMPESIFDSGRSLSVHIFDLAMNVPGGDTNAYASTLTLVLLLFVINTVATLIVRHWQIGRNLHG